MLLALMLDWLPLLLSIIGGALTCGGLRYFITVLSREHVCLIDSRSVYLFMYTSLIWCSAWIVLTNFDNYIIWLIYAWLTLLLIYIDTLFLLLPRAIVWTLATLGIIYQSFYVYTAWSDIALSALSSYVVMAMFYYGYLWLVKHPGMGYGDVRLTVALGIWVGYEYLAWLLMLAALLALIYVVSFSMVRKKILLVCPFGPFLCLSSTLLLIYINIQ